MRKTAKERRIAKEKKNLKEIKKSKTSNTFINNDSEVANFIKIVILVVVLVLIFTLITNIIVNNNNKKANPSSEIQYTKIIVGNILNRTEEAYYVLVENNDDTNLATYNSYISTYKAKEDHLMVYIVDLDSGFNEPFKAEKSNLNVKNISDIRFSNTTLLKIENGKITTSTDNSEKIKNILKDLSA